MKTAIYPGSFDPITNGHLDVIERATRLFDRLIIAVIQNPSKNPFFSIEERMALIQKTVDGMPGVSVEGFQGLLVNFAKEKEIYTIVRGLRALTDFDFEFQMAQTNRSLNKEIDTVFLMTDEKNAYLSSSVVREVFQLGGDVSGFVPETVQSALAKKIC